jgi:hypothetical protein
MEWKETNKEITKVDGKTVSEKITQAPLSRNKKIFGINSENFEAIFKIVGLVSIIISILVYFDNRSNETRERLREFTSDSTTDAHYKQEMRDRHTKDSVAAIQRHKDDSNANHQYQQTMMLAESTERDKQRQFIQGLEFNRNALDTSISSGFRQLVQQEAYDKEKETNLYEVSTLTSVSAEMNSIITKLPLSFSYQQSKDRLFNELKPKVSLVKDDSLFKIVKSFENVVQSYEKSFKISKYLDSIAVVIDVMAQNIDNCQNDIRGITDIDKNGEPANVRGFDRLYLTHQAVFTKKLYVLSDSIIDKIYEWKNSYKSDGSRANNYLLDSTEIFYSKDRKDTLFRELFSIANITKTENLKKYIQCKSYLYEINSLLKDFVVLSDLKYRNMPLNDIQVIKELLFATRNEAIGDDEIKENYEKIRGLSFAKYYHNLTERLSLRKRQLCSIIILEKDNQQAFDREFRSVLYKMKEQYDNLMANDITFYRAEVQKQEVKNRAKRVSL